MRDGKEEAKKYIGNILFYTFLIKSRTPTYLERNLRTVLRHHRIRLERLRARVHATANVPHRQPMAAETPPPRKWNFHEIEGFLDSNTSFNGSTEPVLRVDVLAIRDRLAKFRDKNHDTEPPSKSARTAAPIQATASLTIWTADSSTQETVVELTRRCVIERRPKDSGERYASISLAEPFVVPTSRFRLHQRKKLPSQEAQTFALQLVLTAANETEEWPPVEAVKVAPRTPFIRDAGGLVRFPLLVAKWQRLPRVPETDQESLLEITATQDGGKYKPRLSLKIDASWCEPSILMQANREKKFLSVERPSRPGLSPVSSDELMPDIVSATEWRFEGLVSFMPRYVVDGYVCALCQNKAFADAALLHFHIHNNHELFQFKFSVHYRRGSLNQTLVDILIKVRLRSSH